MARLIRPIVLAGIAVGFLDGTAAVVSAAFRGVTPDRVFQYISSGFLGRISYEGGWTTVALGILLHFIVAFGASTVYIVAARSITILNRYSLIAGPLYGIVVFFLMSEVVSPLSNVNHGPCTLSGMVTGILIHVFFVGLPIALISSKFSESSKTQGLH